MRKLYIALLATIAILLACCKTIRCPQQEQRETSFTATTTVDTITLPADSAIYKALIECRNGKPVITSEYQDDGTGLSIFRLITTGKPKGDSTKLELVTKALQPGKTIPALKTEIVQTDSSYLQAAKQACPGLTTWQAAQIWTGRVAVGLLALYLLFILLIKPFLNKVV